MPTVRFSQVTFATKPWVVEAWGKMAVELFSGRVVAEVKQLDEVCEPKWEVKLKKLQNEVYSLCHHVIHQLPSIAGSYQQASLDDVAQAYMVYALEEAESIFSRGNQAIEDTRGYVLGIRYSACKMREANRKISKLEDMHAKVVVYHNSVKPYMDTLRFHIDQLKHTLHVA